MLELSNIRSHQDRIIKGLESKWVPDAKALISEILSLDEERRNTIQETEEMKRQMNETSRSIGGLMKEGKKAEAEQAKSAAAGLREKIKSSDQRLSEIESRIQELLISLPNVPDPSVVVGRTPEDNVVVFQNDVQVGFDFDALPHWELAKNHDIIDWELGVKLTGAGFPVYKGKGARLERALIWYFLEKATEAGYLEILPPLMVNEDSGFGTGQLPDKDGQMYHATVDNFYLIPTAEVPITNLYRDVILQESELPVKNCGYTPCFRREAGSYGKDVRGLNRLHQFDKVEIVQITTPEKSYETLETMCAHVQGLLDSLELPYRKLLLCTGDMSFTSAKTYDMEVWSAAQERWLEVSSISNFESYQSNRLKLRLKDEGKRTRLAHTLNGSALALPRIVAALLENNQQADGSIIIPEVLRPFTGFDRIG
jgi:seryl-tRNA synthetase